MGFQPYLKFVNGKADLHPSCPQGLCNSGSLGQLWLGLTHFVRQNILKTKILHLYIHRRWNCSCHNLTCISKILNPATPLLARTTTEVYLPSGWICWQNNFEACNPRRVLVLVQVLGNTAQHPHRTAWKQCIHNHIGNSSINRPHIWTRAFCSADMV